MGDSYQLVGVVSLTSVSSPTLTCLNRVVDSVNILYNDWSLNDPAIFLCFANVLALSNVFISCTNSYSICIPITQ